MFHDLHSSRGLAVEPGGGGGAVAPGKRTLSQGLPGRPAGPAAVQRSEASAAVGGDPAGQRRMFDEALRPDLFAGSAPEPPATSGARLDDDVRCSMESSFGADFSTVRVHQGEHVPAIGARAYAQGEAMHFAPGHYDPSSMAGRELIGHELTHVIQQRAGRVDAAQGADGAINGDPGLEREADELGRRAAAGEVVGRDAPPPSTARSIQRRPIQRAIGFEFQTDWTLEQETEHDTWVEMNQASGAVFKDATGVAQPDLSSPERDDNCNFVIEGDDGDVEFVTPPFSETGRIKLAALGMRTFERAVGNAMADGNAKMGDINREFRTLINGQVDPRDATGATLLNHPRTKTAPEPRKYRIKEAGFDDKTARPQATFSGPLSSFGEAMERFDTTEALLGEDDEPDPNFGTASVRARRAIVALDGTQAWGGLHTLLAMVLHYLWDPMLLFDADDGDNPGYAKSSFALMLRNDFASLYTALADHERAQFTPDWVLQVAGLSGDAPIFPRGFKVQLDRKIHFGPSRRAWLDSIGSTKQDDDQAVEGDDLTLELNPDLTQVDLNRLDLMSRGEVRASSAAMGAYATTNDLVIAEWRALEPSSIEISQWDRAMLETFERTQRHDALAQVAALNQQPARYTGSGAQVLQVGLRELDGTPLARVGDLEPLVKVYVTRGDRCVRLIDVATTQRQVQAVDKGKDYKELYEGQLEPNYRFTFETLTAADVPELPAYERDALTEFLRDLGAEDEGSDEGHGEGHDDEEVVDDDDDAPEPAPKRQRDEYRCRVGNVQQVFNVDPTRLKSGQSVFHNGDEYLFEQQEGAVCVFTLI